MRHLRLGFSRPLAVLLLSIAALLTLGGHASADTGTRSVAGSAQAGWQVGQVHQLHR